MSITMSNGLKMGKVMVGGKPYAFSPSFGHAGSMLIVRIVEGRAYYFDHQGSFLTQMIRDMDPRYFSVSKGHIRATEESRRFHFKDTAFLLMYHGHCECNITTERSIIKLLSPGISTLASAEAMTLAVYGGKKATSIFDVLIEKNIESIQIAPRLHEGEADTRVLYVDVHCKPWLTEQKLLEQMIDVTQLAELGGVKIHSRKNSPTYVFVGKDLIESDGCPGAKIRLEYRKTPSNHRRH